MGQRKPALRAEVAAAGDMGPAVEAKYTAQRVFGLILWHVIPLSLRAIVIRAFQPVKCGLLFEACYLRIEAQPPLC